MAQGNTMRMIWGEQIVWVPDGKGGFEPEVRGDKQGKKEFVVDDEELGLGLKGQFFGIDGMGEWYNKRYNPMRDFYWYDDGEVGDYLDGTKEYGVTDDQPYTNHYMTQMNDWRLAFDVMAKYTDTGRTGRGAYDPTEYDDLNREFSRIFKERKNDLASLYGNAAGDPQIKNEDFTAAQNDFIGQTGWNMGENNMFTPLNEAKTQDEYYEMLAKDGGWWFDDKPMDMRGFMPFRNMINNDVLLPAIDNLYKAQYAAAKEQGYEQRFDHLKDWGDQNASTWIDNKRDDTWWMDEQFKLGSSQPTEWSMWYNDTDKDMSIAQTATELQDGDRSRVQKDFLSQRFGTGWTRSASLAGPRTSRRPCSTTGTTSCGTQARASRPTTRSTPVSTTSCRGRTPARV